MSIGLETHKTEDYGKLFRYSFELYVIAIIFVNLTAKKLRKNLLKSIMLKTNGWIWAEVFIVPLRKIRKATAYW